MGSRVAALSSPGSVAAQAGEFSIRRGDRHGRARRGRCSSVGGAPALTVSSVRVSLLLVVYMGGSCDFLRNLVDLRA